MSQIDPAELSPGEFASWVRKAVEEDGVTFVVIDSLNAFLQAMPGEKYLLLQMHELLSYLNQQGVITMLILGQHGIIGDVRSDVDLSYLSRHHRPVPLFRGAGRDAEGRFGRQEPHAPPTKPASASSGWAMTASSSANRSAISKAC